MVQGNGPAEKRPTVRKGERRKGDERRVSSDRRRKHRLHEDSDSDSDSAQFPATAYSPAPEVELKAAELARALWTVIDKLNRGAMLIDAGGRVHALNTAASAMAAAGDAFRIAKGCLCIKSTDQQRRLEQFLASGDCEQALALKVERHRHRPPYRVLVCSLPPADDGDQKSSLFAAFVYQPGSGRQIPASVLHELYGLTPAESRLVIRLFHGESMNAAAASLGIATSTARSHLKRVFSKCEVQTQAELLQLLSLGPRTS